MALAKYPFDQKYLILTSVRGKTERVTEIKEQLKSVLSNRVLQYV